MTHDPQTGCPSCMAVLRADPHEDACPQAEDVISTISDPVERVLNRHQCIYLPDYQRCCSCGELFDRPAGYRRHVAALIYEALDPSPHGR